jgi:hypothetical protein
MRKKTYHSLLIDVVCSASYRSIEWTVDVTMVMLERVVGIEEEAVAVVAAGKVTVAATMRGVVGGKREQNSIAPVPSFPFQLITQCDSFRFSIFPSNHAVDQ